MHRAVEHKAAVSGRRFTIRGSLLYLIFYRLVNTTCVIFKVNIVLKSRELSKS